MDINNILNSKNIVITIILNRKFCYSQYFIRKIFSLETTVIYYIFYGKYCNAHRFLKKVLLYITFSIEYTIFTLANTIGHNMNE